MVKCVVSYIFILLEDECLIPHKSNIIFIFLKK